MRAQQIGQNAAPPDGTTYTLSVKANLVVETVSVKDKQGKPMTGLTAKDFTVTEDGVAQTLKFLEHEGAAGGAGGAAGDAARGRSRSRSTSG